jgi:Replication protein
MTAVAASRSRGWRTSSPSHSLWYRELLALREFGKSLTDDRYRRGCGRRIRRGNVGDADEILETTFHCDHTWLCPVCGYRTARDQSRELAETLMAWTSQGGSVALLTLTQTHCTEDECDDLWNRLGRGWGALVRGSGWRADQETFGLRGYIRITEVVHRPESGWNVHFHVPLLLDEAPDAQHSDELKDRLSARFIRGIRAAGGLASWDGQDLRLLQPGSERQIADYYAKGTKVWRSENSRTPMAILADLKATGEGLGLWKEFSAAVTGTKRKRYIPSNDIANLVPNRP